MGSGHTGPVERARDALDAGAPWRARDILLAHVDEVADPAALTLLAEVLQGMGDLPRAGAMWFSAGAKGPDVDAAVAAWREQSRDDFVVMWRSLPRAVREEPRPPRVEALRGKALAAERAVGEPGARDPEDRSSDDIDVAAGPTRRRDGDRESAAAQDDEGSDAAQIIAWVLAAVFVVLAVIGAVTVLGWVVPG
jgi:aryl-alcohol dehydrogenase-like predicted oxidoreductase